VSSGSYGARDDRDGVRSRMTARVGAVRELELWTVSWSERERGSRVFFHPPLKPARVSAVSLMRRTWTTLRFACTDRLYFRKYTVNGIV
jgi:hypothetical protein